MAAAFSFGEEIANGALFISNVRRYTTDTGKPAEPKKEPLRRIQTMSAFF